MGFLKDDCGQGAVEYLLIIGGAILIAAVVIAILANTGENAKNTANNASQDYNGSLQRGRNLLNEVSDTN